MEQFQAGDVVGFYVNRVLEDRGKVLKVIQPGMYEIAWEKGHILRPGDDIRRERPS